MQVHLGLTGVYPRSEGLVAATRDLDRGRATPEDVERLTRTTEREIADLEARLGLTPTTSGQLRWQDLFRPISAGWGGFTVGPITRWFETNTFFRQPILHHPPERTPGAIAATLAAQHGGPPAAQSRVILPGPYTLAGLLDNRSGETSEALVHRLGRLLAEEAHELAGLGYGSFVFSEPLVVVRPPKGAAAESVVAAYQGIHQAVPQATTLLWTYFADAAPAFPLLARLPVTAVGIDLAETSWADLPVPSRPIGLGLGCLDPRTTLLEDPVELARIARTVDERLHPTGLWLGPGGPLDLLPAVAAERKLGVLPAARAALIGGAGS